MIAPPLVLFPMVLHPAQSLSEYTATCGSLHCQAYFISNRGCVMRYMPILINAVFEASVGADIKRHTSFVADCMSMRSADKLFNVATNIL